MVSVQKVQILLCGFGSCHWFDPCEMLWKQGSLYEVSTIKDHRQAYGIDVFVGISLYNFSNDIHFNIKYIYLFGRCHSILKDNFLVLICFTKV